MPAIKKTLPAKNPTPAKAAKPAKKPAAKATDALGSTPEVIAPPYPGYEPYDVVQVGENETWTDFETIRTPEEAEQARKMCELTGVRTYRIVSGDHQTVKVAPPEAKAKPQPKTKKPKPEPKPKKLSALDAAAKVLAITGEPMTAKALIEAMTERGLWTSPGGQTPEGTLSAAIGREIATKGADSRFRKTAPGRFAFNVDSTRD